MPAHWTSLHGGFRKTLRPQVGPASVSSSSIRLQSSRTGPSSVRSASSTLPRFNEHPQGKASSHLNETKSSDSLSDALDELLEGMDDSLKTLNALKSQRTEIPKPCKTGSQPMVAGSFWRPRCQDDLWHDISMSGDLDSDGSTDSEEFDESAWDFLRKACETTAKPGKAVFLGAKESHNQWQTDARNNPPKFVRQGAEFPKACSGHSPRDGRCNTGVPNFPGKTRQSRSEVPPPHQRRGNCQRAHVGGFRFGSYSDTGAEHTRSSEALSNNTSIETSNGAVAQHEAQVTAALNSAQSAGPKVVRKVLRQLLLRWHPDKAPQGESRSEKAAREVSTQVLRHILKERERLGL